MDPSTYVSPAVECAWQFGVDVVKRKMAYIYNYNETIEEVKEYVKSLKEAEERVQKDVKDAEMNGKEIHADVHSWLQQVGDKIQEYKDFLSDKSHENTRCSLGFFPNNLQLRYRLGRRATKLAVKAKEEQLWNKKFQSVSYQEGPSADAALSNIGNESFESRKKTMEMIMQALEDSTVSMVGVYGVGGVGKTTLIKEVAKRAQEKKLFNLVIMANITRSPDTKKIQGQIAEMLGMRLEEESEIVRADRIRRRLKKEKENTLIILDDLWDGLDLNRLGIQGSDDGTQRDVKDITDFGYGKMEKQKASEDYSNMKRENLSDDYSKMQNGKLSGDNKGCKILLTSRNKDVLHTQMNVKEESTFPVGVLDEKEAEALLKKVAGKRDQNSEFDGKATEIAKMCAGLPIALVSIGRALKNKSLYVWEDVCRQIKIQNFTGGQESIEFSARLSYDHLKDEQLRYIFLHCARMGSDALIMDLVKFCMGLGLLQGVYTIRDARSRVNVLIDELKDSSLLVESFSSDRFNMHDIVRDVALSISSKEKHVFFMKKSILDEWPHKDKLESCTGIFLHSCDINDELPKSLYCPRLEVFHLDNKDDFLRIPDNFFKGMIELRVLILTGVNLPCLPSSIKCLKKLRMLCLERCTIGKDLSIIGDLKKLRILTFSGSKIESLPVELGQLDKLQLFDLSNCSKLRVIPSNTVSRMKSLEELYMRDNLIQWEDEHRTRSENANLSELGLLNQLRSLEINIPSTAHFPQNLFFDKLDSYKIVIGEFNMLSVGELKMPDKYEALKCLALQLKEGINIHSAKWVWVKMLFKRVESLLLGELNDVHDVFYELNVEGFPELKHLSIGNNFSIQYIMNSMDQAFPKLESMHLHKLDNLTKICDNQLTGASFNKLKIIKIKSCGQLKNLFSSTILKLLIMLETIEVCDCDALKEIISVERQAHTISDRKDDKFEFHQLRFLTLQSLPELSCFCSISDSLEEQVPNKDKEINTDIGQGVTTRLSLFDEKVSLPKLEWLELSSINTQKIWNDQSLTCFQSLLTLNVTDCGNLKYLLSFSMAESLVNLQNLFVSGCEMMVDIFQTEDAKHTIDVLPKLKKMEIILMEKLNTIWLQYIGSHSFHSLDSLVVRECHKLVTIFPSYMANWFQSLQSLVVINCESVENVFDFANISQTDGRDETNLHYVYLHTLPSLVHVWKEGTSGILKFNNLKSISVYGGQKLEYLFPFSVANDGLKKLEFLDVCGCGEMKEIVAQDKGSNKHATPFRFPHLNTVSLQQLFELRSFYQGTHTLEWPSLKKLLILYCNKLEAPATEITNSQVKPIFSATEKVIYNLDYLALSLMEVEWLQYYIVSVHRMHKLQSLVLYGLKNIEILFWFLRRLPNLESLTLASCLFKKIWAPTSLFACEKIGVVVQLKELILTNLFHSEEIGFEYDPLLQRVERLLITGCLKLTTLLPSSVSFSFLTYLEVVNCISLKNLMTSSTAKSLVQITAMKVGFCQKVEEIVVENIEEENGHDIEFKQLKALEFVSLQCLTSFCSSEKCDFKFPLLENLVVSECPRMTKFSKVQNAPNLRKVHVVAGEKDRWYWEGDLNDTVQKIFTDQVSFEYSKHLTLEDYPELKVVRHGKPAFPDNFFHSLKILMVNFSFKKDTVIPSYVLPNLKSLEELHVDSCPVVQVVFDIDDNETKNTKGIAFRLKKLNLEDLPNLKCVWNKNPQGIVSFPSLQEVVLDDCRSLTTLFPSSIARNLAKLKTLKVQECEMLSEIVGREDPMEFTSTKRTLVFEFPCLSILVLRHLSQLNCFYPERYHLECPELEDLEVSYCGKLKLFRTQSQSHPDALAESQLSTPTSLLQQPLFLAQKVVPKLKKLALNEKNIILLREAHLPLDKLLKLKLCFEEHDNEKDTLPFDFLHKVPNLANLKVKSCTGLKEIFPSEKLQLLDEILVGLKRISLSRLRQLNSIGLEYSWVEPYSKKLEILKVTKCSRLDKLVQRVVSFTNLRELTVKNCKRMQYLFTFSTAKSLEQLEMLYVFNCISLKEIITVEDECGSNHEITFGRLSMLWLISLPSLVYFYSGDATLHFSYLQSVSATDCLNMKAFSGGVINAPMCAWVRTSFNDFHFHEDLNTTMRIPYDNLVKSACDIQYLKLGDHPQLDRLWLHSVGVAPFPSDNCFNNLTSLFVVECQSLLLVIPFRLLPLLHNLKEMEVRNCQSVKAIFLVNDTEAVMKPASLLSFPLKKIVLDQLPNLEFIWNMNPDEILSHQDLQEVSINNCPSLKSLIPASVANNLVRLVVRCCASLKQIIAEDEAALKGETKQLIFHCLTYLTLWEMPELKYFYHGKHSLEWPMLTHIDVYHCDKLKLFTTEPPSCQDAYLEDQQAIFSSEKVFPKLELLALSKEDAMKISHGQIQARRSSPIALLSLLYKVMPDTMVGQEQFGANLAHFLQNLKVLTLQCFHEDDESSIFSSGLLEKIPSIENLAVACSSFNEVFPSQRPSADCVKILSKIIGLRLNYLLKLNTIGLEHSWVEPLSKTLEVLDVYNCSSLKILVPSTVSFTNIHFLNVRGCHGLLCLFTPLTAKSLGLLQNFHIIDCPGLHEIVSKEGDHEHIDEGITFGKLSLLTLKSLPSMVGFYTGTSKLKFPSLSLLTVEECPQMEYSYEFSVHQFIPNELVRRPEYH